MAVDLPDHVDRYFAAQNAHDVDAMAAAFATDAVVADEGRTYSGREAIREWMAASSGKYRVTVEPLRVTHREGVVSVAGHVAGTFPGSPLQLTYDFVLDDRDLIRRLEIH